MSERPQIPLVPGEQWWRLIRTPRDGASAEEIAGMMGPAMQRFFRSASSSNPWEIYSTGSAPCELNGQPSICEEFRIGSVRPVRTVAIARADWRDSSAIPDLPSGTVLADKDWLDPLPTVELGNAPDPWWIVLRFWWREPPATVDYPALKVSWAGGRSWDIDRADWILDRAIQPEQPAPDPGDATWGGSQAERVIDAGSRVLVTSMTVFYGGIGALALAWILTRRRR